MQMPQLVGIAHHIDRGDPAILDVECRRLQFAIGLQCHETRQAIDEACADEFRLMGLELPGQIGVELHNLVEAEDRIRRYKSNRVPVSGLGESRDPTLWTGRCSSVGDGARQRSNNISHSTRVDVCACGLVAPVARNPQRR